MDVGGHLQGGVDFDRQTAFDGGAIIVRLRVVACTPYILHHACLQGNSARFQKAQFQCDIILPYIAAIFCSFAFRSHLLLFLRHGQEAQMALEW